LVLLCNIVVMITFSNDAFNIGEISIDSKSIWHPCHLNFISHLVDIAKTKQKYKYIYKNIIPYLSKQFSSDTQISSKIKLAFICVTALNYSFCIETLVNDEDHASDDSDSIDSNANERITFSLWKDKLHHVKLVCLIAFLVICQSLKRYTSFN
jgi:hypothetical protein